MSTWAKNAASKLKAQEQAKAIADAKFVEEQKLKRAKGEPLWEELKRILRAECEELNLEMHREVLQIDRVPSAYFGIGTDLGRGQRKVSIEFVAEQNLIKWHSIPDFGEGIWDMQAVNDGSLVFTLGPPMYQQTTANEISHKLLDILLNSH
jgi:hypothetical protein